MLVGLTVAVLTAVDIDPEPVLAGWILPIAVPGALVVAAWPVGAPNGSRPSATFHRGRALA